MTPACPHCRSTNVVRDREAVVPVPRLSGGRVTTVDTTVLRVICREPGCGRNGTVHPPGSDAEERRIRDHVVDRLFAVGQTATAIETGLGRATVQRHAKAWAEAREGDVLDAAPDFLLVLGGTVRGHAVTLLCDADRASLVEFLQGDAALEAWMRDPGRTPALRVALPLDARLRDRVAGWLPGATLLVAPRTMARAVRERWQSALSALRRRPDLLGCNGMPRRHEFAEAIDGEGDTGGWPTDALGLLAAVRCALAILSCRDRVSAEASWREFEVCADFPPARSLLVLFETWRDLLLEGLSHRFLDPLVGTRESVLSSLVARRPALGIEDLRRFALLRTFEASGRGGAFGTDLSALATELGGPP